MKLKIQNAVKLFFLISLPCFFICLSMFFPYNDLKDLIVAQVANITRNSVFLDFKKMQMSFFPRPSLQFQNLQIEVIPQLQEALIFKELALYPSASLLRMAPGFSASAKVFSGDLQFSLSNEGLSAKKSEVFAGSWNMNNIEIQDILQQFKSQQDIRGRINIVGQGKMDFPMAEQPELELDISSNLLDLVKMSINTELGPLDLPSLKISELNAKASLNKGKLQISSFKIGKSQDELFGEISGTMDVKMNQLGGQVRPVVGNFDIMLNLNVKASLTQKFMILSFLNQYKSSSSPQIDIYKLRITGNGFMRPPKIQKL